MLLKTVLVTTGRLLIRSGVGFGGSQGNDGECMDVLLHHVAQAIIHEPMTHHAVLRFEARGYETYAVMSTSGSRAGMAGMQRGFIHHHAFDRIEPGLQAGSDLLHTVVHPASF